MLDGFLKKNDKWLTYIIFILLGVSLFFASWSVLRGNISFHTDIARDFLLIEDIYFNKNITLLGPRAGGIAGVFHGPLWLYINIPPFIFGGGNPIAVGWYWVFLYIITIGIVYAVAHRLFSKQTALVSAALFSIATASAPASLFNPFGAVMLAPLVFLWTYLYLQEHTFKNLALSLLSIGFAIQFQMAFAVPILVVMTPLLLYSIIKNKNYSHIFAFFLLLIPLSSFIVFELRNQFLQTKAVWSYINGGSNAVIVTDPPSIFLWKRVVAMTYETIGLLTAYTTTVTFLLIGVFIYCFNIAKKNKGIYLLFVYLYLGFWIITLPYKGVIWGYYYLPFV